jgi:trk system potassium uptake protein TrkA
MIMGGSRTSVYLARLLDESGIAVTVFERSHERCDQLCDLIPRARVICGDATQDEVLLEEGIRDTDAFVALTGDDENNIITSMYAKRVNVPKIVTKVNREHLADILLSYGIDSYVTPKKLVAQQLTGYVRALNNSRGSSMETMHRLADGKVEALEFKVKDGARIIGVPLKDLKLKPNVLISAVIHDNRTVIPGGATVIESGDHAVVVAKAGLYRDLDEIVEGRA